VLQKARVSRQNFKALKTDHKNLGDLCALCGAPDLFAGAFNVFWRTSMGWFINSKKFVDTFCTLKKEPVAFQA